jgi:hypothetical protein
MRKINIIKSSFVIVIIIFLFKNILKNIFLKNTKINEL